MANRTTRKPRLTNDMIREYAKANPAEAKYAELALAGCRNSRAEIAMELGCETFVLRAWM